MATKAQIEANRRNAAKSTGPRTDEGRGRIAQNALRHGLCSDIPLMSDETQEESRALLTALRDEHSPLGPTEEILVFKMAEYFFNARRASYLLSEHLDEADRGYFRALYELRKTQKERRLQEIGFVSQKAQTAPEAATNQPSQAPQPAVAQETRPLGINFPPNPPSSRAETPKIPLNSPRTAPNPFPMAA